MRSSVAATFLTLTIAIVTVGAAVPANADPTASPLAAGTTSIVTPAASCASQVLQVDPGADTGVCDVTVTTTVSSPQVASDAEAMASLDGQSAAVVSQVQASAETGAIAYQDWSQTYYSGLTWEIQKGRVLFDKTYAWDASHRGYAGSHTCHAPGSISAGLAVSDVRNCNKPAAAASVTFTETFDWSFLFRGSSIEGACEMLSKYTARGVHTSSLSGSC
jgi:hypothetical protein